MEGRKPSLLTTRRCPRRSLESLDNELTPGTTGVIPGQRLKSPDDEPFSAENGPTPGEDFRRMEGKEPPLLRTRRCLRRTGPFPEKIAGFESETPLNVALPLQSGYFSSTPP